MLEGCISQVVSVSDLNCLHDPLLGSRYHNTLSVGTQLCLQVPIHKTVQNSRPLLVEHVAAVAEGIAFQDGRVGDSVDYDNFLFVCIGVKSEERISVAATVVEDIIVENSADFLRRRGQVVSGCDVRVVIDGDLLVAR